MSRQNGESVCKPACGRFKALCREVQDQENEVLVTLLHSTMESAVKGDALLEPIFSAGRLVGGYHSEAAREGALGRNLVEVP